MEGEGTTQAEEAVLQTLKTRGWFIGDIDLVKRIIMIQSALADDRDDYAALADSVESELFDKDLKSFGCKSLPDSNLLHKASHIQGPIVLQISSVRDVSVSSIERFSDSSNRRLLRFVLTDGHNEITAIEYSHVPSIPNDVVPGAKIRLENKAPIHSGIVCLNPKVTTLIGGVVKPLYDEWKMNQKYLDTSGSSMKLSRGTDSGRPPPFEKLQIAVPFPGSSQPGKPAGNGVSTSNIGVPTAANVRLPDIQLKDNNTENKWKTKSLEERTGEVASYGPVRYQPAAITHFQNMSCQNHYPEGRKYRGKDKQEESQVFTIDKRIAYFQPTSMSSVLASAENSGNNQVRQIGTLQNIDNLNDEITTAAAVENIEQRLSTSETRSKEVAELVPVQNQAAAQKLLQKMSSPSQGDQYRRGRKHRGKGKQEELPVFTLDEYEKKKAEAKLPLKTHVPDTSYDEDLARLLQNQIDMEESHVQMGMHNKVEDDIRMSMFNYEKDADRVHDGGREWGRGKGRGRGRGRSRGRGGYY